MKDWTEGFGSFIDDLLDNKGHIYKEGKSDMVHDLAIAQLKRVYRVFFAPSMIGVQRIEDDEGEYGIYILPKITLKNKTEEDVVFDHINQYDADWILWKDGNGEWGATCYVDDVNPEKQGEYEYPFKTHNFQKALSKLVELFGKQLLDDLKEQQQEYLNDD